MTVAGLSSAVVIGIAATALAACGSRQAPTPVRFSSHDTLT